MEKKQTAVEWLHEKITEIVDSSETTSNGQNISDSRLDKLSGYIKQAKQMEREEIEGAYNEGRNDGYRNERGTPVYKTPSDYFTKNYGDEG